MVGEETYFLDGSLGESIRPQAVVRRTKKVWVGKEKKAPGKTYSLRLKEGLTKQDPENTAGRKPLIRESDSEGGVVSLG